MINIESINPIRSAATSILSVMAGTFSNLCYFSPTSLEIVNTMFQHAAWIVAITAGLVSIVNGVKNWKILRKQTIKKHRK